MRNMSRTMHASMWMLLACFAVSIVESQAQTVSSGDNSFESPRKANPYYRRRRATRTVLTTRTGIVTARMQVRPTRETLKLSTRKSPLEWTRGITGQRAISFSFAA